MESNVVFNWNVYSPFFPRETLEATFYSKIANLHKWILTLRPIHQNINTWIFDLTIKCVLLEEQDVIVAEEMSVFIWKYDTLVKSEIEEHFAFEIENRHTFSVEGEVKLPPRKVALRLTIRVEMRLRGQPAPQSGFFAIAESDLEQLSLDLAAILDDRRYSNLALVPSDGLRPVHVHSCMIEARWSSFFDVHDLHATDFRHTHRTVRTDISEALLRTLLAYLYSGALPDDWPDWHDTAFVAELFQVIERYRLYHLYKVFVRDDSHQLQETRRDLFVGLHRFRLDDVNNRFIDGYSETRSQSEDPKYSFRFRIEFSRSDEGPCLSYSLQSRSPHRTQARMNLVFARIVVHRTTRLEVDRDGVSVHVFDYDLEPHGAVASGRIAFVADDPIFADFDAEEPRAEGMFEIHHYIRCYVNLSDGSSVVRVENSSGDSPQSDRERLGTLADHMQALNDNPLDADLNIWCPDEVPMDAYVPCGMFIPPRDHWVHRAIFATRVPVYWGVLENVEPESDLSHVHNCSFNYDVMRAILLYVYAGKVLAYPIPRMQEMYDFAERSEFAALRNMILRTGFQINQ